MLLPVTLFCYVMSRRHAYAEFSPAIFFFFFAVAAVFRLIDASAYAFSAPPPHYIRPMSATDATRYDDHASRYVFFFCLLICH